MALTETIYINQKDGNLTKLKVRLYLWCQSWGV